MRQFFSLASLFALVLAGCSHETNPTPPRTEADVLSDHVQLTQGFQRAGEAYFSPDMQWIIFQAANKDDEDYQMYVARLKWKAGGTSSRREVLGIETPVRITPIPSWNTCGFFAPDGESLIFSSTALNPKIKEDAGGYQRSTSSYRWNMPATAQIFRADNWKGPVLAAKEGFVDLAKHALTKDQGYHAECAYSPDGKWIVYAAKVGGDSELFVMRSDGSRQTRLTFVKGYDGGPFFSPDGRRLVYRSDRKGNDLLEIFVADLVFDQAGNITGIADERQLTTEEQDNRLAARFTEEKRQGDKETRGQREAERPGNTQTSPSSRPSQELLRSATTRSSGGASVVNWTPYWHPDGRHIAYATSLHGHRNYEVYMMRDDGSRKTRITNSPTFDGLPVFSPDGQWLMWTSKRGGNTSQIWIARFRMPEGN